MTRRAAPERTCLGCRRRRPKGALLRLVRRPDGVVAADPRGTAAGRGAYVCEAPACVEHGLARERVARAFRQRCTIDTDLREEVRGLWQRRK
jgi:hypothetical protein